MLSYDLSDRPGDKKLAKQLLKTAFPANELLPFRLIRRLARLHGGFPLFYQQGEFCGLASFVCYQDICYIMYLAIVEEQRGQGLGSELLQLLRTQHPTERLLLEIEKVEPAAPNFTERRRRKDFYLRNSYQETGIFYRRFGVDYEMLACGGQVTAAEFWQMVKQLF